MDFSIRSLMVVAACAACAVAGCKTQTPAASVDASLPEVDSGAGCTAAAECAGRCDGGPDCACIAGGCVLPPCASSAACDAGSVCLAGACSYQPPAAGLRCSLVRCPTLLALAQSGACVAQAVDSQGVVVPGATIAWQSNAQGVATVDATGRVTGVTAGSTGISCTVAGSVAAASTPWAVTVLGNVDAGNIRVSVVDDETGLPVAGATVVVRTPSDGGSATAVTGDGGLIEIAATPPLTEVSVFHDQYNYVTVLGLTQSDIQVPLVLAPDPTRAGGFHGRFLFDESPTNLVQLGIAGLSFPGTMIDFNFDLVIGEQAAAYLSGIYLPLPRAIFALLEPDILVREYETLGRGGRRVRWGLSLRATLLQILTDVVGPAGNPPDPGRLVTAIVPLLSNGATHTLTQNYQVNEIPALSTSDGGADGGYVPDFANMPLVDMKTTQPLSRTVAMNVPRLPAWPPTSYLRAAVGVVGALVPAQGFTPLGLGAASDTQSGGETPDGFVDTDKVDAGNQTVMTMKVTPNYGGVEDSPYMVLLLAASFSGTAPGAPPAATSGLLRLYPATSVLPEAPNEVAFEPFDAGAAATFLDLALGTTFDSDAGARVVANVPALTGAKVYRVAFGATRDRRWFVYFTGAGATIPAPPNPAWDLTTTGNMRIDAIALTGENSIQTLFRAATPNFRDLSSIMNAFSTLECRRFTCNGTP